MNKQTGYFKQNFAKFLAQYDAESYEAHKPKKQELFAEIEGLVLEIGPGTGVNFRFLAGQPIHWTGIEPNSAMHPFLFEAATQNGIEARLLDCTSEEICLPDDAVDFVISTEVMCSVTDLKKSLLEIHRVLKPGGKFLFLEHVVDKHNLLRRTVQKTVPYTPWKCYSDGCHPARDIAGAIQQVGFEQVAYTEYMQEGKGIIQTINRPHIVGWASK